MLLLKRVFIAVLDILMDRPFINFLKYTEYSLVSDRAKIIADKIGWDKLYEKAKEAQKNGTSMVNIKD
jgi:hypothetical protein